MREFFEKLILVGGDRWLSHSAFNITLVDEILIDKEEKLARLFFEHEKPPLIPTLELNALTQMWVMAFYEIMRLIRQRRRAILNIGNSRKGLIASSDPIFEKSYFELQMGRADTDLNFRAQVQAEEDNEALADAFQLLAMLRVHLAKHEVQGLNQPSAIGAPRVQPDGSVMYFPSEKSGATIPITRKDLKQSFCAAVGITSQDCDNHG